MCVCLLCFRAKKAAVKVDAARPPKTRKSAAEDAEKREKCRIRVAKHRANMSGQKKRRIKENRRKNYHSKKAESKVAKKKEQFKECPYPTKESLRKAVKRLKDRLKVRGERAAHLLKGFMKSSDKETQQKLQEINVQFQTPEKKQEHDPIESHLKSLSRKRDRTTLQHKRLLASSFSHSKGFTKRYLSAEKPEEIYKQGQKEHHDKVKQFYLEHSQADPCKVSTRRQLLLPTRELHKLFEENDPDTKISLRTFNRLRPKNVASVRKAKFRQCLCEVCMNPKMKVERLNRLLKEKCGCVRDLLNESMCAFCTFPKLECVERKCWDCGVNGVKDRLLEEFGSNLKEEISWMKWEQVKEGKTSNGQGEKEGKCGRLCNRAE